MSKFKLSEEQSRVISSKPGFVLSAGAGSGKTFVLVEYVVNYIYENLLNQNEKEIKSFLSQIYLMTFTKKATAEIALRIQKRISEIKKTTEKNEYFWELIEKNLFLIKITTIDSFCMSLLESAAYLKEFNKIEIKSNDFINLKIEKIFIEWFIENEVTLSQNSSWSFSELLKTIIEIFNDPEVRLEWTKKGQGVDLYQEFSEVFRNFIKNSNFKYFGKSSVDFDYSNLDSKKPIAELFAKYSIVLRQKNICDFQSILDLFGNIKSFPQKLNDMTSEQLGLRVELKALFDFYKSCIEDFYAAVDEKDSYEGWQKLLLNACMRIEEKYHQNPGYSFSDITYFTYKLLSDSNDLNTLPEIKLMIVDEFQDTSRIQFEIIQKCLRDDLNKLVVVGDKKQAIYGFRGGDVGVYGKCEDLLGKDRVLNLKDNYRSEKEIVIFNNDFFHQVFTLADGFVESDVEDSIMESQNPQKMNNNGRVVSVSVDGIDGKITNLDSLEAELIKNEILTQLASGVRQIAVLYKNLNPSFKLIDRLISSKVDLVAQVKISNKEDLVLVLCEKLVSFLLTEENDDKKDKAAFLRLIKLIVETINPKVENIEICLSKFEKNVNLFGFYYSFLLLLSDLGITSTYYKENLEKLNSYLNECRNNLELFHFRLKNLDQKYTINFVSGNGGNVTIQTAHQSKGLEYESVFLAGIYTNGSYQGFRRLIGNIQGSFRWFSRKDRKLYKSMNYFLDETIEKQKNFLESKRLFYVASTRAKETLTWIKLIGKEDAPLARKNSWAIALNNFANSKLVQNKVVFINEINFKEENSDLPLFYKLDTGVSGYLSKNNFNILPELSVTKLSKLKLCPRMFYLESVCKIEGNKEQPISIFESDEFVSSKKRGIYIHNVLFEFIQFGKLPKKLNDIDQKVFEWVKEELSSRKHIQAIPEQEIKFELNDLMINAIPDLVLISADTIEIIDYKTGAFDHKTHESYLFQVNCYMYGFLKLNSHYKKLKLKTTIFYLDQFSSISKDLEFNEIQTRISEIWSLLDKYDQVNVDYCLKCNYDSLCKYSRSIDPH